MLAVKGFRIDISCQLVLLPSSGERCRGDDFYGEEEGRGGGVERCFLHETRKRMNFEVMTFGVTR